MTFFTFRIILIFRFILRLFRLIFITLNTMWIKIFLSFFLMNIRACWWTIFMFVLGLLIFIYLIPFLDLIDMFIRSFYRRISSNFHTLSICFSLKISFCPRCWSHPFCFILEFLSFFELSLRLLKCLLLRSFFFFLVTFFILVWLFLIYHTRLHIFILLRNRQFLLDFLDLHHSDSCSKFNLFFFLFVHFHL